MAPLFKIALIGEAWGEQEEIAKRPFIGAAGQELDRILVDAGISRSSCFLSNVLNLRPPGNDLGHLCCTRSEGGYIPGYPAIAAGRYLRNEFAPEVSRLYSELREVSPNVTVLLGPAACWALLGKTQVSKLRGAVSTSHYVPGLKVIPTYHPAAVLREYDLRTVTVLDFMKAAVEAEFPEVRRSNREIWLDPTLDDIERFTREHINGCKVLAFDIETSHDQITCIGFAPRNDVCLVVPFWDVRSPNGSYWKSAEEEDEAWRLVAKILDGPEPKVGQNGLYDIQYLWMKYGIPVRNYDHDTMLLHHSLMPEAPKGLDFLGSVYCNEPAWKMDRPKGKNTIKRED